MKKSIILFLMSALIIISSCSKKEETNLNTLVIYTPATRFFIDRLAEEFNKKNLI